MNKILIVSRHDDRPSFDTSERVQHTLAATDTVNRYDACYFDDLYFVYDGQNLHIRNCIDGAAITDYDLLFLLGWFPNKMYEEIALSCASVAKQQGIAFVNSEALKNRSRSKLSQYVLCALNGVRMTAFCFSMSHEGLLKGMEESKISYPFILKAPMAARGKDNYLIHDRQQLDSVLGDNPDKQFIIQEFVPNDGDIRLIVMGDTVKLAIARTPVAGSHLSNTSQGGAADLLDIKKLPAETLTEAVRIAKILNRELTGVDMIQHRETGEYYFLEANNMPQLSTGAFVDKKAEVLASYFNQLI